MECTVHDVCIRWLIRRDMPEVLRIENESFADPWVRADFIAAIRQSNCVGMVAEHNQKIVGFMLYELHTSRLHILKFAVATEFRRQRVGSAMVQKLIGKLGTKPRPRWAITLAVPETHLAAQLLFREHGFRAVSILRDCYGSTDDDTYVMQYINT